MKKYLRYLLISLAKNLKPKYQLALTNIFNESSFHRTIKDIKSLGFNINHIYDIGAFNGNWSKSLSAHFNEMNFYLFEANKSHEQELKLLPFDYYIGVLSNIKKNVLFYSKSATGDSYFKEKTENYRNTQSVEIQTETLDSVVEKKKIPFPDFIKIDTQGSELDILFGAKKCLANTNAIMLECPIYPYNSGAPTLSDYVDYLLKFEFYPAKCTEIHNMHGVMIQIDIIFISKKVLLKSNNEFKKFYLTD